MELYYREFSDRSNRVAPLVFLHGLLGSASNWQGIAQRFSQERRVIVPDQRNHGRSPHSDRMSYQAMAQDLDELLVRLVDGPVHLVGHSMGGKTAMAFALTRPNRVAKLVIVDTAPVKYPNRHVFLVDALIGLDLSRVKQRRDADRQLAATIPEVSVRNFLLQNLERGPDNRMRWRVNLTALQTFVDDLMGFPCQPDARQYAGNALFIYGGMSDYVTPTVVPNIRRLFPRARLQAIEDAGHWVHAEQPAAFVAALKDELNRPEMHAI